MARQHPSDTINMKLFSDENFAGVFRGFTKGGLEFHADIVLPYKSEYQKMPMHGQFLLVQLEHQQEAVLGRITSLSSDGKLASGLGEDFSIKSAREKGSIPEDVREAFLKYRVNIRVLGVISVSGSDLQFVASHRRLPHLGAQVGFPSADVLRQLVSDGTGALIGHLAFGEYVYLGAQAKPPEPGMCCIDPEVPVCFNISNLISRRSFIFARAGFGKSNLNKLLFSELYKETPTTKKADRDAPVGSIIFDPDGEYFWPDDRGNPGLCDVPHLVDKLVVFTRRQSQSAYYQSFVAGGIRLDVRRLKPSDVIAIALGPDRQDQQNVRKLRGLSPTRWEALIDLIHRHGNNAPLDTICRLMDLDQIKQEVEAIAARSNLTTIVRTLHDPSSQLMDMLIAALRAGKLCVIDISQMRGAQSLILSGLILKRIFDRNQEEFTAYPPQTIPVIAVVEEAQSVLHENATSAEPYISWVKEGRKYDLGALLITQQPGSIPLEILSQGDNWFVFHLLSSADLHNVAKANAHFSDDVLSSLLNEPIPGQGVFWSSAMRKSYPIALRVRSFSQLYKVADPERKAGAAETYAAGLAKKFNSLVPQNVNARDIPEKGLDELVTNDFGDEVTVKITIPPVDEESPSESKGEVDVRAQYEAAAIGKFRESELAKHLEEGSAVAWGSLKAMLKETLSADLDDRDGMAYQLVKKTMETVYGSQNSAWHSYKDERGVTVLKKGAKPRGT